jgi:hypothetical protein
VPGGSRELSPEFIRSRADRFVDMQVWPTTSRFSYALWLNNFLPYERQLAHYLLNGFHFYSENFVRKFVRQVFTNICSARGMTLGELAKKAVITFPIDDVKPEVTDSGFTFVRYVREEVPELRHALHAPAEAVRRCLSGKRFLVFVDDFAGSGLQMNTTWQRTFDFPDIGSHSFEKLLASGDSVGVYSPLFATETAIKFLKRETPGLSVEPVNTLGTRYSALSDDSAIWPDHLRSDGIDFLLTASARAGLPDYGGSKPGCMRGFANLGLSLAIDQFIPDATLPIYYQETAQWTPLVRRR